MTPTVKRKTVNDTVAPETAERSFADNRLAMELFGSHHRNLARIEQVMDVAINARGNEVTITGDADAVVRGAECRVSESVGNTNLCKCY